MKKFYQQISVRKLFLLIILILGIGIEVHAYTWDEANGQLTLESTSPTLENLHIPQNSEIGNIISSGKVKILVVKGNYKSMSYLFYNAAAKANLTTINLSESKLAIISNFSECPQLTTVKLPLTMKCIASEAFKHCELLKNITLTDSIEEIRYGAFEKCLSLDKIIIPASVKTIGGNAFADCPLTELNIPAGITSIQGSAFACKNLAKLNISTFFDNTMFSKSSFGSYVAEICEALPRPLVSDDGKAIYLLPAGENVVVTEGIEYICSNLEQRSDIKILKLPSTLKYIGKGAFNLCHQLEAPEFPASLDYVGPSALCWSAYIFLQQLQEWRRKLSTTVME